MSELAEGARLEIVWVLKRCLGGSNPPLSAKIIPLISVWLRSPSTSPIPPCFPGISATENFVCIRRDPPAGLSPVTFPERLYRLFFQSPLEDGRSYGLVKDG